MTMSVTEAVTWIANQITQAFTVRFVKRTDGTVRELNCMLGKYVKKGIADGERAYDPTSKGLIWVVDLQVARKIGTDRARRSIPVENLQAVKIDGVWVEVTQP